MKVSRWLAVGMMVGGMAGAALAAEDGCLVKIVGFDRKAEMQAMTETDFKALEKTIKLEQRLFSKAVEMAAKDWRADELNKGKPFPGSRLVCRSIGGAQSFTSLEKAEAQLTRLQEMEGKKTEHKGTHSSKKKGKEQELKEMDLLQAADLVKTKLAELVAKAGGDAKGLAVEPAEVKKPDAKGKADAVKKAL